MRHYRDDADIDRVLDLVKTMWSRHNFLNLAEVFYYVCHAKEVDVKHLSDIQLTNYIENYLETDNSLDDH